MNKSDLNRIGKYKRMVLTDHFNQIEIRNSDLDLIDTIEYGDSNEKLSRQNAITEAKKDIDYYQYY